ncbi:glycosyltransferase [Clostridioides sp. ES-S-0145-01]|uniref:glycosyltransferase n=1 Tax=Clostridioides sp. ES-S-0145-01 TaxID=2770784 RepID=UPI001D12311F|nr:glycosyltransferase [Clostridioides sp. ES-S-0145-01]
MNSKISDLEDISNALDKYVYSNEEKDIKFTSIVISNYNELEYLKLCIKSIRKFTPKNEYEIIVVNNCSNDETTDWVKQQKDIISIHNEMIEDFAICYDKGLNIAKGENIVFLNSDVIVTQRWLYNLHVALWSNEKICAVGPVSNNLQEGQKIDAMYSYDDKMFDFTQNYNSSDCNYWRKRTNLEGFCIMFKRLALEECGIFDNNFKTKEFGYYDFSFRLISLGYSLVVCMDTFLHNFNIISKEENTYRYRNIIQKDLNEFINKWGFNPKINNKIKFDLISLIKNNENSKFNILDIGCGTGASLNEIKNRYKNADVYGIDLNKEISRIAKNICKITTGDIENVDLEYEEGFFDYIMLGDVFEDIKDSNKILKNIKKILKKDGFILFSISNIMYIDALKSIIKGKFYSSNLEVLSKSHLRFFTIDEVEEMFANNNYLVDDIFGKRKKLTQEDINFINSICGIFGEEFRNVYEISKYFIRFKNNIDFERYKLNHMIELRYMLMRIDNKLDVEASISFIFDNYEIDDQLLEDIKHLISTNVINKIDILNKLSIESFNRKDVDFSISMLMRALEIDRNDIDTVYNISYMLCSLEEYDMAYEIIQNSNDEVKTDIGIVEILHLIGR